MSSTIYPIRQRWTEKPLVIIESPYRGMGERGVNFARACLLDSLNADEAPFAFHLLYTQVLDDDDPVQRKQGMLASASFYPQCSYIAVYQNFGISTGMEWGIKQAEKFCKPVDYRFLKGF